MLRLVGKRQLSKEEKADLLKDLKNYDIAVSKDSYTDKKATESMSLDTGFVGISYTNESTVSKTQTERHLFRSQSTDSFFDNYQTSDHKDLKDTPSPAEAFDLPKHPIESNLQAAAAA